MLCGFMSSGSGMNRLCWTVLDNKQKSEQHLTYQDKSIAVAAVGHLVTITHSQSFTRVGRYTTVVCAAYTTVRVTHKSSYEEEEDYK